MSAIKRNKAGNGGVGGDVIVARSEEASLVKPYGSQTPKRERTLSRNGQ